jgi:hypothetical protein
MTDPDNDTLPPLWLERAELHDLSLLAPDDPVRLRRLRALYAAPMRPEPLPAPKETER